MQRKFDAKEAEKLLREVYFTREIFEALGTCREEIERVVTEKNIREVQRHRMDNLDKVKRLKEGLEEIFPEYRFSGRMKSLPSIFGKRLCHRTLADIYGIKVVVRSIKECYAFAEWLHNEPNFRIISFEDKIVHPKANGYRDLQVVVNWTLEEGTAVKIEFIIQTERMYVDSHTIQKHSKVYPWKYHDVIKNLPAEYEYVEF